MVLSKAAEDRKQRILLKREQARQEINERRRLAKLEGDSSNIDVKPESGQETCNSDEEEPQPDKKPKLDIPDAKTIVSNVFRYLNQEYKFLKIRNGNEPWVDQLAAVRQRTAEATGFSKDTVRKIVREDRERIAGRRQIESENGGLRSTAESDQVQNEDTTGAEGSC